jgi:lysophospholipase L1-like esterase
MEVRLTDSRRRQLLLSLVTVVALVSTVLAAAARSRVAGEEPEAWVGTWATAVHPAPAADTGWPEPLSIKGFKDHTVRMVVRTSVGGTMARLRISNRYGTKPLVVGHATIALPLADAGPGDLRPGSVREATFAGQRSVTVPRGGTILTDPVTMEVAPESDVAISLHLPVETGPPTLHNFSRATSYIGPGDHASSASGAPLAHTFRSWYYLSALDVLNRSGAGTIAVLGDSVTDGIGSTNNTNHRWTNFLAARLNRAESGQAPGVLNLGLAGNRLGHDGADFKSPPFGDNALARFAEDVLAQAGVRAVIVQLGINDIWMSHDDANVIIAVLQQLAEQAHQAGLEILVCTIGPWKGLEFPPGTVVYSSALDSIRLAVNSYLRTNSDFDGVIDLDAALRDRNDPVALRPDFEPKPPDHIHPNDTGAEAMANAVDIDLLVDDG